MDKVKPLKLETTTDGSSNDYLPREMNPLQDYAAAKGVAFENLDTFAIDKIGRFVSGKMPDTWQRPTYLGNGEVDYIEYFNSSSFVDANRLVKVSLTYDVNLDPATEVWLIYDTDGVTVLRTITYVHTFVTSDLTQSQMAIT